MEEDLETRGGGPGPPHSSPGVGAEPGQARHSRPAAPPRPAGRHGLAHPAVPGLAACAPRAAGHRRPAAGHPRPAGLAYKVDCLSRDSPPQGGLSTGRVVLERGEAAGLLRRLARPAPGPASALKQPGAGRAYWLGTGGYEEGQRRRQRVHADLA